MRRGISLIVLAIGLLVVLGVAFFVYRTEHESWQNRQAEAAHNAARIVDSFMRQVQGSMALFSLLDRDYLEERPEILHDLLDQTPALLEVVRLDPAGQVFAGASQDTPVMANLFTIPQSTWFLQAQAGQPYVGQVQISADNEPYLIIAVPAPDGGVTAARLRMDVLWDVVAELQFGKTGQAYVVNRKGEIVAHSQPEIVLAPTTIAGQPELDAALDAPDNHWQGIYRNFAGTWVVGYTTAVPDADWIIFTEVAWTEAHAATGRALLLLGGGLLLVGLLMMGLFNRLMKRGIFDPIEQLRDGAGRIGQGDLAHRIQAHRLDEIGQVAEAFNNMAARLQDREAALEAARDEALEASRFKSRLLANVGHDLRTPLSAILGYADMLQEGVYGDLGDRQRKASVRILSNAKRLLHLINSLLDQAQIEAGQLTLHYEPLAPVQLLAEIEATMSPAARAKELALETRLASDVPDALVADVQRIHQIVMNLVENAIKFTTEGRIAVRLYLPDADHWAIEISDTGCGIAEPVQRYIFEPFRQGDDSTTREYSGVGLGLSIVKQLTTLMGGEIHLASEVGQGSTFTVVLPLHVPEEEAS
jgi:signal transduction histidine kinase